MGSEALPEMRTFVDLGIELVPPRWLMLPIQGAWSVVADTFAAHRKNDACIILHSGIGITVTASPTVFSEV